MEEYRRRNKIIEELVSPTVWTFNRGELAYPKDPTSKLGLMRIINWCSNWNMYKGIDVDDENKVKWPTNDNPMIVHAFVFKEKTAYNCTTDFFRKLTDEELADARKFILNNYANESD